MCDPITAAVIGAGATAGAAYGDYQSNKKAMKSAERQREASQAFIEKQIKQARSDIFKLFPAAQESRNQGLQAGLNLYSQAMPQMMNTYQQGNVEAQKALITGLPQMQNAIMGKPLNPVNLQGLQPVQLQQPGLTLPQVQPTPINELGLS